MMPWLSFTRSVTKVVGRASRKINTKDLNDLNDSLSSVKVVAKLENMTLKESFSDLTKAQKTEIGDKILTLYFEQLKRRRPVFFDLRPSRFSFDGKELSWAPGNLFFEFDKEYLEGLNDIYTGFYTGDMELFDKALIRSGLVQEAWPKEDKEEVRQIFLDSFGSVITEKIAFTLSNFEKSFERLFIFYQDRRHKVKTDFSFLGSYLVTLYLSLDPLGQKHDVAGIFNSLGE